jgi:hypothetical protein
VPVIEKRREREGGLTEFTPIIVIADNMENEIRLCFREIGDIISVSLVASEPGTIA